MPAEVIDSPLGLSWIAKDGASGVTLFGETPNSVLARQLLVALTDLVHPHGGLNGSGRSLRPFFTSARQFVVSAAADGHEGGAADLTRAQLASFLLRSPARTERQVRKLLLVLAEDPEAGLDPGVRALAEGRAFNPSARAERGHLQTYSEAEWAGLRQACRRVIDASWADYRRGLRLAESGRDPVQHGFTAENVLWWQVHHGPAFPSDFARLTGKSESTIDLWFSGLRRHRQMLFPDANVVMAYQLLFGIHTGIVPDGIDDLELGAVQWAGDATVLLDYVKGRTAVENLVLNQQAIRLLERWLEYSALARRFAPQEMRDSLWIRLQQPKLGVRWCVNPVRARITGRWTEVNGVMGDDGRPLALHRHRIRTSFHALRDRRAWTGSTRATIDPNHGPQIEGDAYLGTLTAAEQMAVDDIVAGAQADVVRRARPPIVLDGDSAAELAERFPQLVADAGLDDTALAELAGGQRDVFVAGCANALDGPVVKGQPCPARPWVCLLCPLAVFAPRHVPNLLRLSAYFARQWQAMPTAHFMAVFGPYAQRIDQVIKAFEERSPAVVRDAAGQVADTDEEIPLLPEEFTA